MKTVENTKGPLVEEISEELASRWEGMIEAAEQDTCEVRVSFRWLKPQVDVIKRAAAQFGIPYQTYIKQAIFRQALADLQASAATEQLVRGKQ
jgi:predicted DNA binding CopG/RHH family protein